LANPSTLSFLPLRPCPYPSPKIQLQYVHKTSPFVFLHNSYES